MSRRLEHRAKRRTAKQGTARTAAEASWPLVMGVGDLRRCLGIGEVAAYGILHALGRKVGKKLLVLRSDVLAYLIEGESK